MRLSRLKYVFSSGLLIFAQSAQAYSFAKTSFAANYESYFSSNQAYFGGEDTKSEFSTAGINLDYYSKRGKFENKLVVQTFYSFAEDYPFINPTEAYTDYHAQTFDSSFGRKLEKWSETDEFWELGLWQPRFMWDKMHPETVGLTGFYFKAKKHEDSRWLGFLSPFYIPEQGPHFYTQDGFVTSRSPWFTGQPKQALIGSTTTPLSYTIDRPSTEEVVLSPSAGFRVESQVTENDKTGFAYSYKPVNQMLLSYDYRLRLSDAGQTAPVTVVPVFPYHHILTTDWHNKTGRWNTMASATYERPEKLTESDRLISQQIGDQILAAGIVSFDMIGEGPSAFKVYGGILKSWGAVKPDSGDTLSDSSQFELRQRWLEAYRVGVNYPIWTKWRRLQNKLELTYDRIQNGSVFSSQVEYNVMDQWILTGSFDMLAVYDSRETEVDKSFIRQFRANDRVSLGFSYAY